MGRNLVRVVAGLLMSLISCGGMAQNGTKPLPLIFGVVPLLSSERVVAVFEPLVDYLSEQMQVPLRIETAPNYRDFYQRTNEEERYDFLLTESQLYAKAWYRNGYKALVRVKGDSLRGAIVVRKNSPFVTAADLIGKSLAIGEDIGFASILSKMALKSLDIDPARQIHMVVVPNFESGFYALLRGRVDAVAAPESFYKLRTQMLGKEKLRVLLLTDSIPNMPISVAPWVSDDLATRAREALSRMDSQQAGSLVLKKIGYRGFEPSSPEDYAGLESLLLTSLSR